MNWFINVFLESLEGRYIARKGKMWLTSKQVDVCRQYMNPGYLKGQMFLDVNDKHYSIQIAPNGCAAFHVMKDGWEIA